MSLVTAVSLNPRHGFSKQPQLSITLLAGLGVQGDAHCGSTVQHRYLKRKNPHAPNRMQIHLIASELFSDLAHAGFDIGPGQLGENITTCGIDLLSLPLDAQLHIGSEAIVQLTGLRSPCKQIDDFKPGLLKHVVERDAANRIIAKAGVMAIVLQAGTVMPNDSIRIDYPPRQHRPLCMI